MIRNGATSMDMKSHSMSTVGFVLLTHNNEDQALRLAETLGELFDDPPVVCHHDFSQAQFDASRFPSYVRFVRPHVNTRWGTISLVHAMLQALRTLYDYGAPDWFYILSGSDYPIKNGDSIIHELQNSPYDVYMRLRKVDHRQVSKLEGTDSGGLDSPSYARLAYQRYIGRSVPIPSWRHPYRGPAAMHLHLLNPKLLRVFHPFNDHYFCYAGDQWFAANARAARALLSPDIDRVLKYFAGRFPPDEAVFPTVLGNNTDLRISNESKHFIRWEGGHHPRMLDERDLPEMLSSSAHFARKFAPESPVLDHIDRHVGLRNSEEAGLRA
jgi:hypothetical protein